MGVVNTPVFNQAPNVAVATITNTNTSSHVTFFTAGANGSKIEAISLSSTDTNTNDVAFYLTRSATHYLLTTMKVPLSSGNTNALPAIDVLRSAQWPALAYDAYGNRCIWIMNGDTLTATATNTVTNGKAITLFTVGGDL